MEYTGKNLLYENIIESLHDGLFYVDSSMRIMAFNQAMERMTELSRDSALGRLLEETFAMDAWLREMVAASLKGGKIFSDYDGTLYRRFSPPLPVGVSTILAYDEDGSVEGVITLIKDISGIKSLEGESLRKERLQSLGTFALNLAHEIRNPLGGIKGAAQLLSRRFKNSEIKEYSDVIVKEVDRLSGIVKEMLNFSRPERIRKKTLNIHKVLDNVALVMGMAQDENVRLIKEYDPSLPMIKGDEDKLTQVFLNIVKNARESIGERPGEVRIITRMITDFHLVKEGEREAKFVEVEIKDTGCGIAKENMEKISLPFFTTKSGGSGLGLAISYRIIKEHGGFLKVESEPKRGSRFRVYLLTGDE